MKKSFFSGIFQESEEEIKSDIERLENDLKRRKKDLESAKKRKKSENSLPIYLVILAIMVFATSTFFMVNNMVKNEDSPINTSKDSSFEYVCRQKNQCIDCDVAASCVQMEELVNGSDYIHFEVDNKEDLDRDCYVTLSFIQNDKPLISKNYSIGKMYALESRRFKIWVDEFPDGDTQIAVIPYCS